MKVIDIKNLHKTYKESEHEVHAVQGIDLTFEKVSIGTSEIVINNTGNESGWATRVNNINQKLIDEPTETFYKNGSIKLTV